MESDPKADVATLATPIRKRRDLDDPACVKVVRSADGTAMYFSRSVIPHARTWDDLLLEKDPPLYLQHLGIYAYRRDFLINLGRLLPSELENVEKLEQLRFLQSGCRIAVGIVARSPRGIDTREDYDSFKTRIASLSHLSQ